MDVLQSPIHLRGSAAGRRKLRNQKADASLSNDSDASTDPDFRFQDEDLDTYEPSFINDKTSTGSAMSEGSSGAEDDEDAIVDNGEDVGDSADEAEADEESDEPMSTAS